MFSWSAIDPKLGELQMMTSSLPSLPSPLSSSSSSSVLQAAETGSGKTGAFCLPIIQIVHETTRQRREGRPRKREEGTGEEEIDPFSAHLYF